MEQAACIQCCRLMHDQPVAFKKLVGLVSWKPEAQCICKKLHRVSHGNFPVVPQVKLVRPSQFCKAHEAIGPNMDLSSEKQVIMCRVCWEGIIDSLEVLMCKWHFLSGRDTVSALRSLQSTGNKSAFVVCTNIGKM